MVVFGEGDMDLYSGKTGNLGVIGHPIEHSLSPVMQNAALREMGLDYAYIAMPVKPKNLAAAVEGLRCLSFRGFNVTIPHKTDIMAYLDEIHPDARGIGAVNTVVNDGGCLTGYNTDAAGFLAGLRDKGVSLGGSAVVLGAGGAARAVLWGLRQEGVAEITLGVRNVAKAQEMLQECPCGAAVRAVSWAEGAFSEALQRAELIVNTTPLGMYPQVEESPPIPWEWVNPKAVLYDLIYTPDKTRFLAAGERRGHRIINGLLMLVGQGAAALQLWTGREADRQVMARALLGKGR